MDVIIVGVDNSNSGRSVGVENLRRVIFDKAMEGYKYASYISYEMTPYGRFKSYDLFFVKGNVADVKFETVKADTAKGRSAVFSSYSYIMKLYEDKGYDLLGAIPTKMGHDGNVLEMDLVFAMQK